jgi:hypothetical protein
MTEENKVKIDSSEFMDWKNNKITQLLYKRYKEDKEFMEARLLTLPEKEMASEKIYWSIRGNINAINHTLNFIDNYEIVETIMEDLSNE